MCQAYYSKTQCCDFCGVPHEFHSIFPVNLGSTDYLTDNVAEAPPIAATEPAEPEILELAIVEYIAGENDIIINPGSEWELEGIV